MLDCSDYERLIARAADDPNGVAGDDLRSLDAHLASCASCRSALGDQRAVATALATRPFAALPARFHARLASRLDGEPSWLPLANWRAWTGGLVPIAAALLLAAWLTPGADVSTTTTSNPTTMTAQMAPTFDTWAASNVPSPAAAALLQPDITGDSLLEVVLTNTTPAGAGSDVR